MPRAIYFTCPCGRTLRVAEDQAGTQVQCWDCQRTHVVPFRGTGRLLAQECLEGVREFVRVTSLCRFLAGGLVISLALSIPVMGPALGLALLAMTAGLYPEVVRRSGRRDSFASPDPDWRARVSCLVWGPVLTVGLMSPVLLRSVAMDRYELLLPWRGPGVAAAAAACWLALPLAVLLTSTGDRTNPVPAGRVLAALWLHPWATSVALLLLPLGMLALEAVLVTALIAQDWFNFFIVDLLPNPASDRVALRMENDFLQDPNLTPFFFYWAMYTHGLKLGYTLIGTIPASLPRGTFLRAQPWFIPASDWHYPLVRALHSALILSGVGVLLAIQARCLGLIATVDPPRRTAPGKRDKPLDP